MADIIHPFYNLSRLYWRTWAIVKIPKMTTRQFRLWFNEYFNCDIPDMYPNAYCKAANAILDEYEAKNG